MATISIGLVPASPYNVGSSRPGRTQVAKCCIRSAGHSESNEMASGGPSRLSSCHRRRGCLPDVKSRRFDRFSGGTSEGLTVPTTYGFVSCPSDSTVHLCRWSPRCSIDRYTHARGALCSNRCSTRVAVGDPRAILCEWICARKAAKNTANLLMAFVYSVGACQHITYSYIIHFDRKNCAVAYPSTQGYCSCLVCQCECFHARMLVDFKVMA